MKKAILVLALVAFAATGAFGQIVFGLTGAQYYEEDSNGNLPTLSEAWVNFKEGTGVFWGGYGEIILDKLGLGMSFNQQTYKDPMYTDPAFDMWNYDVNFFLSYHIFGGRAFLDPFLQAGVGVIGFDFKNKDELRALGYTVSDDPLSGSGYMDFGLGLGINLGGIGIFGKGMWNVQSDEPLYYEDGAEMFPEYVYPFKWVFGVKLIL